MASARARVAVSGCLIAAATLGWASPAAADHLAPCTTDAVPGAERLADTHSTDNIAFDRMHIGQAQQFGTGQGTKIAVIDSGVWPVEGLNRTGGVAVAGVKTNVLLSGHGTIVAGLIAGPKGVAPQASIFDVKVYDSDNADASQGERAVTSAGIVAGINEVIAAQPREQFDVVNISLAVTTPDPVLEEAVKRLVALDVVVVAAAGNASGEEPEPGFRGTPDSDANVYPADYPGVLAVSATPPAGENPSQYVLPNLDTDVAAPTVGAQSTNANGQVCDIAEVATSWAAAEVSGIMALLRARFPRDTPEQLVARLQATTEGAGAPVDGARVENPWTGAGVVQAHDALARQLKPGREGKVETTEREISADAQAPPAPERLDLFSTPRAILLWSGLAAGALLALAFMLRPLIRRS